VIATGTGTVTLRGCTVSISHTKGDRRVQMTADMGVMKGTATLTIANQPTCTVTDANMANNTCACPLVTK